MTATDKIKVGNLLSIGNDLSGGVSLNSRGGTIYGGGSSIASRSITTPSVSDYSGAPRIRGDDTSSISSFTTPAKKTFNPNSYGLLSARTASVTSTEFPKGSSQWARMRAVPSKVNSDAARLMEQEVQKRQLQPKANTEAYQQQQQQQLIKTHSAVKSFGDEDQLPSDESEEDEPAPKQSAPACKTTAPVRKTTAPIQRAQTIGTFSLSDIQAVIADMDQDARGDKPITSYFKRQTTTDISRQVYSQEEAYHEIAEYSDGSLSDDSEDYGGVEVDEGFHG
jgi:hypothetical protein